MTPIRCDNIYNLSKTARRSGGIAEGVTVTPHDVYMKAGTRWYTIWSVGCNRQSPRELTLHLRVKCSIRLELIGCDREVPFHKAKSRSKAFLGRYSGEAMVKYLLAHAYGPIRVIFTFC